MRCSPERSEALVELYRRHAALISAEIAQDRQVSECWRLGVPARRIAAAIGTSTTSICRRYGAAQTTHYNGGKHENVDLGS